MCFSSTASFTAAAVLAVIGSIAISQARPRQYLLAVIPLLFSLQQISEGILWLDVKGDVPFFYTMFSRFIYLFFAYLFWPVWGPLSIFINEKELWRKKIILWCLGGGVIISLFNLISGYQVTPEATLVDGHFVYGEIGSLFKWIYLIAVLLPLFVCSMRLLWIFGLYIALLFFISNYYFSSAFTSIWCFFTAIGSVFILVSILYENLRLKKV